MLAALAEATARVEIGTLVTCAGFRNPAVLAKMAATLDEVSGGRLILGLGAGWNQAEFDAFGVPFGRRVTRLDEALRIIVPLLREGRVSFEGTYHRALDCELVPRGPRPAGPPILVAGFGPRMLRLAARHADSWNGGYVADPGELDGLRQALREACAETGRDPATLGVTAELKVAHPDLGPPPPLFDGRYATGPPEAVAGTLSDFAQAGFAHVMCTVSPHTREAVRRLGTALRRYRAMPEARGGAGRTHP
jgi:alkanesulfonate monooxygenase SsuD/methylene tetrahydromethanopterin reductase-like flavin-dependent oxidoreductase (luciferase family)